MHRYRYWLAMVMLACAAACGAQGRDTGALLRSGKFEAIEERLRATDAAFRRGELSEHDALEALRPFYQREDVLSAEMDAWVRQRPDSDIAYLARATYRRKLGEYRDATDHVDGVPDADARYTQAQFEAAKKDLAWALQINPRSYLALLNRMNIAMAEGDEAAARETLALANKAYPRNLLVRARYMVHLQPRRGGSYARMDAFIAETRALGAPSEVVDLLTAIKLDDVGFSAAEAGDSEGAKRSYDQALSFAGNADRRFVKGYLAHAVARCVDRCARR